MMTPEGKVKKHVKEVLKRHNAWYFMPPANGFGRSGVPDIVVCLPTRITPDMVGKTIGLFVGIETKAPGKDKNTTANQKAVLKEIVDAQGSAFVTSDPEQADVFINAIKGGTQVYLVP